MDILPKKSQTSDGHGRPNLVRIHTSLGCINAKKSFYDISTGFRPTKISECSIHMLRCPRFSENNLKDTKTNHMRIFIRTKRVNSKFKWNNLKFHNQYHSNRGQLYMVFGIRSVFPMLKLHCKLLQPK